MTIFSNFRKISEINKIEMKILKESYTPKSNCKMVKLCSTAYPKNQEEVYKAYFENYSYPLSDFQKYAIQAIVDGNHALVCCPTGSGKSLPAEFAIEYFASKGKKIIYTSPIKALSNQKFHEFTQKYPNISFGLITGDIKTNPDATVLIMTTEILLNKLYQLESDTVVSNVSFDMDINTELACVVFDEVHYINDTDRGKVWEQSIMMLPVSIQMVMLSATIDQPENFATWIESRDTASNKKQVYLATSSHRIVPLTHYTFISCTEGIYKIIKDKEMEKEIRGYIDKPQMIQTAKGVFQDETFHRNKKIIDLLHNKRQFVKRTHVLNQACKYMVENNMLPALCFVLSRKQLEICAKEVTAVLLEDDSKVPYIVRRECEQIIRKLPNFQEYLELPEYLEMVALLEKGIAIHHAGVMPVLREMVELLYAKGYIKLLFATETFAIGINMPTKTVLFTDVNKYDGNEHRLLYSHEYTQMAGRAGRRGIDTVGQVIHLNNLFRNVDLQSYKIMMNGKPQMLTSKFKISYNLLLSLIGVGNQELTSFAKRSMIQDSITSALGTMYKRINELQCELDNSKNYQLKTPRSVVEEYLTLLEQRVNAVNKKRKEIERKIKAIQDEFSNIEKDKRSIEVILRRERELNEVEQSCYSTENFLNREVDVVLDYLISEGYIEKVVEETTTYALTRLGKIASHLRETPCLAFAKMLELGKLNTFNAVELITVFSCFTNITVSDDIKAFRPDSSLEKSNALVLELEQNFLETLDFENKCRINTGTDYSMQFDLMKYIEEWTLCEDVSSCKFLLQKMENEKGIFLGEFVKAILKINNISSEMEKVAEMVGNMELLDKLKKIQGLTMKFVATNQSLYV